ncbi:uncharacterized protein LOC130780066 [Actinidia eriantha]|uniref:uncharacterized protein LOC130780066 n=1 Tax=Actinidia eriantha TaxID=165200 RepID=UPI0025867B72|nr:uncharacterized protein LOC130780066 [Actinidia eriantha]
MKMRNKGKVYPSPSSSSSSIYSYSASKDALSVLKFLPAAILALISVLSLEDREVLAYMITRSVKLPNPSSIIEEKKKNNKKSNTHKPPVFDCDCFDCYISFWFRWDSSPNRELIHQAIEAFEEHLATGEQAKRNSRGKKREKIGRRGNEKPAEISEIPAVEREVDFSEADDGFVVVPPENEAPLADAEGAEEEGEEEVEEDVTPPETEVAVLRSSAEEDVAPPKAEAAVLRSSVANNHKGLVRKVLPDVVGLLNSRLWSLWSPNV